MCFTCSNLQTFPDKCYSTFDHIVEPDRGDDRLPIASGIVLEPGTQHEDETGGAAPVEDAALEIPDIRIAIKADQDSEGANTGSSSTGALTTDPGPTGTIVLTPDIPGNSTTPITLAVGDSYIGMFETAGDWDWVAVNLVAGRTYTVTLDGHGANPNDNPYLIVYAPGATDHNNSVVVDYDNNGLPGSVASVTFTATTSGTYYVGAIDFAGDEGNYEISVINDSPSLLEDWTYQQIAQQLSEGYWGGTSRSWDMRDDNVITYNISSLSFQYQEFAVRAFDAWADLIDVEFIASTTGADIYFTDSQSGAGARSWTVEGDDGNTYIDYSWINIQQGWSGSDYTFQTFMHEIGHALGLGHAGNYNGAANYSQYNTGDADYLNDSWQASIMSYFHQTENTHVLASFAYLLTPMLADILAIQSLYDAAENANLGDSVYGYNNNTGNAIYDASVIDDMGINYALTIIDNGGIDTIDLSGSTDNNRIDLTPGSYSDTGGLIGNLGIAFGTIIENAIGGSGHDSITGNDQANMLSGGAGTDTLIGGDGHDILQGDEGADILNGGAGLDWAYYINSNQAVTINLEANTASGGHAQGDSFTSIERVLGSRYDDSITGNAGVNVLRGYWGDDTLAGGGGNDILRGDQGADNLNGGAGLDWAYYINSNLAVTINLEANTASGGHAQGDSFTSIERVLGSWHDDSITGDAGVNVLRGYWGDDTLAGGSGNDTLRGERGADTFVFSADGGSDRIVDYSDTEDTIRIEGFVFDDITIIDESDGALINYGGGEIKLTGIDANLLSEADFVFA